MFSYLVQPLCLVLNRPGTFSIWFGQKPRCQVATFCPTMYQLTKVSLCHSNVHIAITTTSPLFSAASLHYRLRRSIGVLKHEKSAKALYIYRLQQNAQMIRILHQRGLSGHQKWLRNLCTYLMTSKRHVLFRGMLFIQSYSGFNVYAHMFHRLFRLWCRRAQRSLMGTDPTLQTFSSEHDAGISSILRSLLWSNWPL